MAKETINATIRLPKEIMDAIKENGNGDGVNAGTINTVRDLIRLRRSSDMEIRGIFTSNEWRFLADSLNSTVITDDLRGNKAALIAHNEDSEIYDGMAGRHDVNVAALNAKCEKLTGAQVDALYRRVERFWNNPEADLTAWAEY